MKRGWRARKSARVAMWIGAWAIAFLTMISFGVRAEIIPPPGGGGGCTPSSPCSVTYEYPWTSSSAYDQQSTSGCPLTDNGVEAGPSANAQTGQIIVQTSSSVIGCAGASITSYEYLWGPDWTAPAGTTGATFTFWWYVTWTADVHTIGDPEYSECQAQASAYYEANVYIVNAYGYLTSGQTRQVGDLVAPTCPWYTYGSGTGPNDISFTGSIVGGYTYQPYSYFSTFTEAVSTGVGSGYAEFNVGTDTNSATFYEVIISYWG